MSSQDSGSALTGLDWVNEAPKEEVKAEFATIFGCEELAEKTVWKRPFTSVEDLTYTAGAELELQTKDTVLAAIKAHPAIGGPVKKGSRSEGEQSAALASPDALDRIAELGAQYEEKFGYTFLIRAAGRTSEEIAAELELRLGNDPETEWDEAAENLLAINTLRLEGLCAKEN